MDLDISLENKTVNVCNLRIIKPGIFKNCTTEPLSEEEKTENLYKAVIRILGLLYPQSFSRLVCFMKELAIDSKEEMEKVAELFLDEAIKRGEVCESLALMFTFFQRSEVPKNGDPFSETITFREILIEKCKIRLMGKGVSVSDSRYWLREMADKEKDPEKRSAVSRKHYPKINELEQKFSNLISFIVELLRKGVLSPQRLLCFIQHFLGVGKDWSYIVASRLLCSVSDGCTDILEDSSFSEALDPIYSELQEVVDTENGGGNISSDARRSIQKALDNRGVRTALNRISFRKVHITLRQWPPVNLDEFNWAELAIHNLLSAEIIVDMIIFKAVYDPRFAEQCATLCNLLKHKKVMVPKKGLKQLVLIVVRMCQAQFKALIKIRKEPKDSETSDPENQSELLEEENCRRRRALNMTGFICELRKKDIFGSNALLKCVTELLEEGTDLHYECLSKLLKNTGHVLEENIPASELDSVFRTIEDKIKDENEVNVSQEARSLLQEVIELRKNKWKPAKLDDTREVEIETNKETAPSPDPREVERESNENTDLSPSNQRLIIKEFQELVDLEKRGGCLSPEVRRSFEKLMKKWISHMNPIEEQKNPTASSPEKKNSRTTKGLKEFYKDVQKVINEVTPENFVEFCRIYSGFPFDGIGWDLQIFHCVLNKAKNDMAYSKACAEAAILLHRRQLTTIGDVYGPQPQSLGTFTYEAIRSQFIGRVGGRFTANEEKIRKLQYQNDQKKRNKLLEQIKKYTESLRKEALGLSSFLCEYAKHAKSVGCVPHGLLSLLGWVETLLAQNKDVHCECACEILKSVGPLFEEDYLQETEEVFEIIGKIFGSASALNLSTEVLDMLRDVVDLRENNWEPVTGDDIRKTAKVVLPSPLAIPMPKEQVNDERNICKNNWRTESQPTPVPKTSELLREIRNLSNLTGKGKNTGKKVSSTPVRRVFKEMAEEMVKKSALEREGTVSSVQSLDGKSVDTSSDAEFFQTIHCVLNKMSLENFDKLFSVLNELPIDSVPKGRMLVDKIYSPAIEDARYQLLYANLCARLQQKEIPVESEGVDRLEFRKILVTRLQSDFETCKTKKVEESEKLSLLEKETDLIKKKELYRTLEEEKVLFRRRSINVAKFIGELFKKEMLTYHVLLRCVDDLLLFNDERSYEELCGLLETSGALLDQKLHSGELDRVYEALQLIVDKKDDSHVSPRVRFMIANLIELHDNKWLRRRGCVDEVQEPTSVNKSRQRQSTHQKSAPRSTDANQLESKTRRKSESIKNWRSANK